MRGPLPPPEMLPVSSVPSLPIEQIVWHTEGVPDADITVLINIPDEDEPIWFGYWDGECWRLEDARLEGMPLDSVIAWADMPRGVA